MCRIIHVVLNPTQEVLVTGAKEVHAYVPLRLSRDQANSETSAMSQDYDFTTYRAAYWFDSVERTGQRNNDGPRTPSTTPCCDCNCSREWILPEFQ